MKKNWMDVGASVLLLTYIGVTLYTQISFARSVSSYDMQLMNVTYMTVFWQSVIPVALAVGVWFADRLSIAFAAAFGLNLALKTLFVLKEMPSREFLFALFCGIALINYGFFRLYSNPISKPAAIDQNALDHWAAILFFITFTGVSIWQFAENVSWYASVNSGLTFVFSLVIFLGISRSLRSAFGFCTLMFGQIAFNGLSGGIGYRVLLENKSLALKSYMALCALLCLYGLARFIWSVGFARSESSNPPALIEG